MISVTLADGRSIQLNRDLIEMLEATPDTIVQLVDGRRFLVRESVDELAARVREYDRGVRGGR